MQNVKLISVFLFLLMHINSANSFYLGGQISVQNLILKQDNFSLTDFNLEMNETQTIINFNEALTANQSAKSFSLDCQQEAPVADLDVIGIIQRCTNNGKITADEVIVTETKERLNDFKTNHEPIAFIFSRAIFQSMQEFSTSETTIISDIELIIVKNKFDLELIVFNVKPKIKGEIYISDKTIRIKIISARVSVLSIKAKLLAEIKKMEDKYPLKVTDDVIEVTIKN
ncbi:MAG: hypothetical protein A2381_04700 [Bdellovibrionales bacterium RIFOXYB1_FULL_37_110]|nr:MAG: hypothetical protein A2181_01130 [Bdellovibrionales bacterium RIFOXYA1_FULL_38_20]OFZ50485.1 MAG: hypothetical protein A2417_10680 [Bdellovibrionales bacterium RIFOXYC1_FULL_37_79]OFZ60756.1 MAG: hypothetical protein A2381_04700 [Bdellovibrionales bacterium RIFOXYB1_FULL_37_110]OFZ64470.1 MAG: hypothetical protein A2577_08665 [Bdellovibrionales bacterium RIFOXYD1_FULL_36_51]